MRRNLVEDAGDVERDWSNRSKLARRSEAFEIPALLGGDVVERSDDAVDGTVAEGPQRVRLDGDPSDFAREASMSPHRGLRLPRTNRGTQRILVARAGRAVLVEDVDARLGQAVACLDRLVGERSRAARGLMQRTEPPASRTTTP